MPSSVKSDSTLPAADIVITLMANSPSQPPGMGDNEALIPTVLTFLFSLSTFYRTIIDTNMELFVKLLCKQILLCNSAIPSFVIGYYRKTERNLRLLKRLYIKIILVIT